MARSLAPIGLKLQAAMMGHLVALSHEMGRQIYFLSGQKVVVDTGALKRSAELKLLPDGFVLTYRKAYAARIEYGMRAHIENVRYHRVKGHLRRVRHRRKPWQHQWVKGHYREGVLRRGFFRISAKAIELPEGKTFVKPHARHAHQRHVPRQKAQPYLRPARRDVIAALAPGLKQRLGSQVRIN